MGKQNYFGVEVAKEFAPSSFTAKTQIRVQRIDEATYVCYFTDREYVLKYKTVGFICSKNIETGFTSFSGDGGAPFDLLLDIWVQVELKLDDPDMTLTINSTL